MYARVVDEAIVEVGTPTFEPIFFADRWWDCRDSAVRDEYIAAAGWLPLVEGTRPPDTETTTSDSSIQLVDGVPTRVWTTRPWTTEELAERAAILEREAVRLAVDAIITDLQAEKDRAQAVIDATNTTINASPAAYIKDAARAAKRIADAAIDLAKWVR